MSLKQWVIDLMLIPGLAGYEGRVRKYLKAAMAGLGITSSTDRLGNLIATLPGDKGAPQTIRDDSPADDVTVHTEGDAVYQEYRRGGRVYMVVVTQKSGLSYTYMVDSNGTMRATEGAPPVRPVMYKILEWGGSKPAESDNSTQGDNGH